MIIDMPNQNPIKAFMRYRKSPRTSTVRRKYLRAFEKKMIFRTTKTENPETTWQMVVNVLNRFR